MLLAALQKKLATAKATLAELDRQQGAVRARVAVLDQLAADARRAADSAQQDVGAQRRLLARMVASAYTSRSASAQISPDVSALVAPAAGGAQDVLALASLNRAILGNQSAQLGSAGQALTTSEQGAARALASASSAADDARAVASEAQAARAAVVSDQKALTAKLASVRSDLAKRRAAQKVTSASAREGWKAYLAELSAARVTAPDAAALADPAHLPAGLSAVKDASGTARPGVATARYRTGTVLVLSRQAIAAITFAFAQLGKPYVWAASGPKSFDCSGLMLAAYRSAGVALPRTSQAQYVWTTPVKPGQEMPGDLVYFAGSDGTMTAPGHVGLVIDPVTHLMIQAPQTGDVVKVSSYEGTNDLVGFGRIPTG